MTSLLKESSAVKPAKVSTITKVIDMLDNRLTHRSSLYINGRWCAPENGLVLTDVINAADGSVLGHVPSGGVSDIEAAVQAARAAFESWSNLPPSVRADYLMKIQDGVVGRAVALAEIIAQEVGMPLKMASAIQVGLPVTNLGGFVRAIDEVEWEYELGNSSICREAAGVVAAITPWNYPLHQLVGKVGGALAAGCTVVAKPADIAPLSAFILADAIEEAGLPAGVFNLVSGPGRVIGDALSGHADVDLISFTGSTAVGSRIAKTAANNITRVALELGGKSASILLDDADLEKAVKTSVNNCFLNSGQTCSAWTRLVVPRSRQEVVIELAITAAKKLTLGHPMDEGTRLGPLACASQMASVLKMIKAAEGSERLVYGGSAAVAEVPEGGFYVHPTIFADVDNKSPIAQDEVFGPVLVIIPYDSVDEAVAIANDSAYGLAGAVWGADQERAVAVAKRIRTGQVDVNGGRFNPAAPFGGYKKSGYGREFGALGIEEFTELKAIQQ
ncbi:aldehyde dehydrogenase family protein [Pacificibacter marinus]|uniref:aldehyde dehydrogenase family protein n=1 Tax=Pacificibacter marinus TaxID=658057 RepID=UPI001C074E94|nr:aldehyde dehydrogenase family protein [Pacificibacter marinus]MBU2867433.1 aldehyde dehydrogenase family protein [Pacificibacter marinus]